MNYSKKETTKLNIILAIGMLIGFIGFYFFAQLILS